MLVEVELHPNETESIDSPTQLVIDEAARIVRLAAERPNEVSVPALVSTNFRMLHALLREVQRIEPDATEFCEWGSGLGIVSQLAELLGFQALGIEIDANLVATASKLAQRLGQRCRFFTGSFIPRGGEKLVDELDDLKRLVLQTDDTYERMGRALPSFDVVYVYPWPGEVRFIRELFDVFAKQGAYLVAYHGAEESHVHRKS